MKHLTGSKLTLNLIRLSVVLLVVAIAIAGFIGRSQAAPNSKISRSALAAVPRHSTVHLKASHVVFSGGSTRYLYVDDGTSPDSIDVYAISTTLTHVGNFPNNASRTIAYYGATTIDVTPANSTHGACLLLVDNNGFVDSFTIVSGGGLGSMVSQISDGGSPTDVHISKTGNLAYVINPSFDLESYSIGSGCTLTALHTVSTPSQLYLTLAIVGGNRMVLPDLNSGNIDKYVLGSDGSITFLKSQAGQIAAPDSITEQNVVTNLGVVTNIFTGQATFNPPQAQAFQYSKNGTLVSLIGSPSSDPTGSNGAAVTFDDKDSLLIQGEQASDTLGVYTVTAGVPGTPGTISFKEQTPMAVGGESPLYFAQLHSTLFVDMTFNGDVEACTMSAAGVSGCATVATLTNTSGVSSGIVIL